ncbi:MAG: hypothetical protein ABJA71_00980 [Ginsengibacter sp.]
MQTTKRPTGLRTKAVDYVTIVQQAINKVTGFQQLYKVEYLGRYTHK